MADGATMLVTLPGGRSGVRNPDSEVETGLVQSPFRHPIAPASRDGGHSGRGAVMGLMSSHLASRFPFRRIELGRPKVPRRPAIQARRDGTCRIPGGKDSLTTARISKMRTTTRRDRREQEPAGNPEASTLSMLSCRPASGSAQRMTQLAVGPQRSRVDIVSLRRPSRKNAEHNGP